MDSNRIKVNVNSEIGQLQHVLIHTPGQELENMTPDTAHHYLYSDILNLQVAQKEYGYFKKVLQKATKVHEVTDLLTDILRDEKIKSLLVNKICKMEDREFLVNYLLNMPPEMLSRQLIEGVTLKDVSFINKDRFALPPLPNLFFMRDASFTMFDNVMISQMATQVRARECVILDAIFNTHPLFETKVVNPVIRHSISSGGTVEGGDVLILRDDVVLCGLGSRSNMHGMEALVEHLKTKGGVKHLFIQELPLTPESFIHLDMVFTMLDVNKCMAYKPVIMDPVYKTYHITIDGQKTSVETCSNLIKALRNVGIDLEPIFCGGGDDYHGSREQWHSGCNFFCLAPGKFIGYGRNNYTLQTLSEAGFNIVTAADVVNNKVNLANQSKCIIAFEGNELSRGGGGARCMTMPVQRMPVEW